MNTQSKTQTTVSIDKEVLEITKGLLTLPWRIDAQEPRKIVSDSIHGFEPLSGENIIGGASQHHSDKDHALMMVQAVNGTYGNGINPDGIKELYNMLSEIGLYGKFKDGKFTYTNSDPLFAVKLSSILQKSTL